MVVLHCGGGGGDKVVVVITENVVDTVDKGLGKEVFEEIAYLFRQKFPPDFLRCVTAEYHIAKLIPSLTKKERRFYASQQRLNQEPTDCVYDLLKLNKKLELGMSEKAPVDHIFARLEPQVQNYVEARKPQNTVQLLEVLAKFEERYSCKAIRASKNSDNVERRGWNEHRISNVDDNRRNWKNSEVVCRPSNGRIDYGRSARMAVKEISGSNAGIYFRKMIADLTIGDTSLEMEVKRTILVEGTTEIGVEVRILVEAIGGKGDD
ncbi:uncharacterized protein TNCV_2182681 [Trichonephila clavipes]|uniref:Uncharacterized protein n=1 Tax=Trichonephila clavipes TaxID=2585209 RepID=A0A8X6VV52_TRICX|nr:uncharacterized protein TNCV_2182681 [Trichonephila clavipes]